MVTKLTGAEALRALADGHITKRVNWTDKAGVKMSDRGLMHIFYDEPIAVNGKDFAYDDWVIVEEPTQERLATTLEECYQAKQVDILWPNKCESQYVKTRFWGDKDLAVFLAALSLPGARVIIEEA